MRHKFEPDPTYGSDPRDILHLGRRRCIRCGLVQRKFQRQVWMRVVGYRWSPDAGQCVKLKWKKAVWCHQETHCKRYWVERDPAGGHFNRWHAHCVDYDEQLTGDGFDTRAEAKQYCEQHARENKPCDSEKSSTGNASGKS